MEKFSVDFDRDEIRKEIVSNLFEEYPEEKAFEELLKEGDITYNEYEIFMKVNDKMLDKRRREIFKTVGKMAGVFAATSLMMKISGMFEDEKD